MPSDELFTPAVAHIMELILIWILTLLPKNIKIYRKHQNTVFVSET